MFCEGCGSRLEFGTLVCALCGTRVPDVAPTAARAAPAARGSDADFVLQGPACTAHAGMPLVGSCPRCAKSVCIRCAPEAARDVFTCTDCHGLTFAHQHAPQGAACALHPERGATFICSRCGSFACSGCAAQAIPGQCVRCCVSVGVPASRGSRFLANFVDNLIVMGPVFLAVLAIVLIAGERGSRDEEDLAALLVVFGMLAGVVLGCGLQLGAQIHWGQSIGKRWLGIKVVRVSGEPIELWRLLLLRNFTVQVLSQLCGLVGLVDAVMIFGEPRRCLHDYLADSVVIEVQRE